MGNDRLRQWAEGYRWLWRAQREWRPGPGWLAGLRFAGRVVTDLVRSTLPTSYGGSMIHCSCTGFVGAWARPGPISVAVLLLAVPLAVVLHRDADERDRNPQGARWVHTSGGFEVAFPGPWRPAPPEGSRGILGSGLAPIPGSHHIRRAGGTLRARALVAQVFDLGPIPTDVGTLEAAARAATSHPARQYRVRSPARSPNGVYLTAHRLNDEPASRATLFIRGRSARGFMVEVTGHRADEPLLLSEAHRIAEGIRLEGRMLGDREILIHEYLDVPVEASEGARHVTLDVDEWFVAEARFVAPSQLSGAVSLDVCRAGAGSLWGPTHGRWLVRERPRTRIPDYELRLACPTSSVVIRSDLSRRDWVLRQFDQTGALVYEKDLEPLVYRWFGSGIS